MDMVNFVPIRLWNSLHHFNMNFKSLSLTIEFGSPCNQTTSLKYFHDSSLAVILVCVGIR